MEIRYSTGQHARDARPKPAVCESFDAFERLWLSNRRTLNVLPTDTKEQLSAKKDRLHYFWVDMLDPAVGRKKVNAGNSYMLRFDMDGTTAAGWETLRELFNEYRGFAYSTASHEHTTANGEQRWRIVLAVSRPVSPAELERISPVVQQDVMDTFELISDEPVEWDSRVYNAAWLLFGPDERANTVSFTGSVVDVDEVLSRAAPADSASVRFRDPAQINPSGTDDIADYLIANGYATGDLIDGIKLPITCPFEDGHSSSKGEGDTSTVYLLEKTSGFDLGKFVCLHNSCKHRAQEDFLDKIGYRVAAFEDLTADKEGDKPEFVDINTDMTSHFLERFIYVIEGDQVCDLSRPPYQCMMGMKSFKNLMAPYQFPPVGKGLPTPATKRWIEHRHKKIAETTGYKPGAGRIIERFDGRFEINEFYMPEHPRTADTSKVSTFLNHMAYLVPDAWQREFFIARLGWMVQRPERRCPISILHVATAHGTGRGWVSQLMERVLGPWNCARTRMKILCDNQFHDYLYNTLLCTIDEVRENDKRYEVNDKIRDVLTEPRFEVNRKYGSKKTMDIYTGFLFYTNHFDALALPEEDRRIAVLGGPDFAASEEHYASLYGALSDSDFIAQVYWYLMGVDLSRFNWQRAPETKERQLMIESNKSDVESALIEILDNPPAPAMTYQQIVNAILAEAGMDVEINQKHITRVLKERTKREPVRVKIDGFTNRFWLLEKNREFSNEELREIYKTCDILQSGL
ncbi:primase-helicase family protein [Enterobacter cloacae]